MSSFNDSLTFSQFPLLVMNNKVSKMKDNKPAVFGDMQSSTIHHKIEMADIEVAYDKTLNECKLWNRHFIDKDFQATVKSLSENGFTDMKETQRVIWQKFVWKKAADIYGPGFNIFSGKNVIINPSDIKQGQLGDCGLVSAISALAEKPQIIVRLFSSVEKNSYGVFGVWLNIFGEWTNVVLDEFFPCLDENQGPAFSSSKEPEIWVLLIEKAYAKVYGSYESIQEGDPSVTLRDLTGAPYQVKDEGTADEFWEYIEKNMKLNFILTCYTKTTDKIEEEKVGLISSHAYSLLARRELILPGGRARLVQLRNPWGRGEWKGDWSSTSDYWTPELKIELGINDNPRGIFWISIEDFVKYFQGVVVACIHERHIYNSIKIDLYLSSCEFVCFEIKRKTHCYFSISQKDSRNMRKQGGYVYSYARLIIGLITENGLLFRGGKYGQERDISLEVNLGPGNYLMLVEVDWMQPTFREITLSSYSDNPVQMSPAENKIDPMVVKRNLMKSFAEINGQNEDFTTYDRLQLPECSRYVNYEFGFLYFYFNNLDKKKILQETVQITKHRNLKIMPPFQSSESISVSVPPEKDVVILFSYIPSKDPTTEYAYNTTNTKVDIFSSSKFKNLNPDHFKNLYIDPSVAHLRNDTHKIDLQLDPNNIAVDDPTKAEEIKSASSSILWVYFLAFEKSVISKLDSVLCTNTRIQNWGLAYLISLAVSLVIVLFQFLMRANYWDLCILLYIALLGSSEGLNKERMRYCSLGLFISGILDIFWTLTFLPSGRWTSKYIDMEYESGVKGATIVFVFIYIIWRIWFFFITWRSAFFNQTVFPQIYSILYDKPSENFQIKETDTIKSVNQNLLSNPPLR